MKLVVSIIILFGLCSCANNQPKQEPQALGKYVYLDDNDVYHSRSTCVKLSHGHDDNGHEIYAKHPIDTVDFYIANEKYFRVCSRCVTDRIYEQLLNISERNSIAPAETDWRN